MGAIVESYQHFRHDSGVVAYDYGATWIPLRFVDGKVYRYTASGVRVENLRKMKCLAEAGEGLTTVINTHREVRDGFDR